jgi:hypothetical protein
MTTTTTAPPTSTRSPADVVAHLRELADLIERARLGELAAAIQVDVELRAVYGRDFDDDAKRAMVDQLAALTGQPAAYDGDSGSNYGLYRTVLAGPAWRAWRLVATAYVRRPDPTAALHAEIARLRATVAAFEHTFRPMTAEDEREAYAQAELDQDRNPTDEGFAAWQARRAETSGGVR